MIIFPFLNRFPIDKLVLKLHYPEDQELTFHRNINREIWLTDSPNTKMRVKNLLVSPDEDTQRGVTDGAIAGVTAAAMFDRDSIKGAIIGDWWQKEQDKSTRLVNIVLVTADGEEKVFQLRTFRQGVKNIKRFFKK